MLFRPTNDPRPILPRFGEELGVDTSLLGILTAYAVALAVFALLTGPISLHLGRL